MKPSDRGSRAHDKALACAPVACRPVAEEVVLMHQRGLDDATGRLRAQEGAADAQDAERVARSTSTRGGAVLCVVDRPASRVGHLRVRIVRPDRMRGLAPLGLDRSAHRVRARWTDGWIVEVLNVKHITLFLLLNSNNRTTIRPVNNTGVTLRSSG